MATLTSSPPQRPQGSAVAGIVAPLSIIVLGAFMAILDSTVVNVALPTLGRVFDADLVLLQWVITGYMLANAAVIPLAGWLSDRFGAKRIYITALVLFAAGSALCASAISGPMLILFRVLQGLGGGMLMPVGMSFIYRLAPPDRRGAVMGIFGVPMLLGPAMGPVISGWLLQYADWRLIFLINLPVGALATVLALRWLPPLGAQRAPGRLDLLGALLGPLAFSALSFGISESTSQGWTGLPTLGGLIIGLLALAAFIFHELRDHAPLLELRVFARSEFRRTIITAWIAQGGMFGTMFMLPLFLQQVRGYGPLDTGLFTLPQSIAAAAVMPLSGRLFDRRGVRIPAAGGLVFCAGAMGLLSRIDISTGFMQLLPALVLWGAGLGLLMMPLNTHLLNSAPRELVSRVTSLTGACQNVVWSLATATAATILQSRTAAHAAANPDKPAASAVAFGEVYLIAAIVVMIAIPLVFLLRNGAHDTVGPPEAAVAV